MGQIILNRIVRLVREQVEDLFEDQANPDRVTRKSDRVANELRHELGQVLAERYSLEKALAETDGLDAVLRDRAEVALERGDEDQAREELVTKAEYYSTQSEVKAAIEDLTGYADELSAVLKEIEAGHLSDRELADRLRVFETQMDRKDAS